MAWMLSPVIECALVALALGFTLYLICTVKVTRRAPDGRRAPQGPAHSEIGELKSRLDQLVLRQRDMEENATRHGAREENAAGRRDSGEDNPTVSPARLRPGMNLSRRSQVLRLYRRGETPEQIASALAAPAGEVRLLLKVHRILTEQVLRTPEVRGG